MQSYEKLLEKWQPVIGLEVHIQLATETKMFCSCRRQYGAAPNTLSCPVCLGMPGSLPVVNSEAANLALKFGLAVNCQINKDTQFARKNYFYPDLPKGYQISQFENPICGKGALTIQTENGEKNVGITRAHLEEDAGKLLHEAGESSRVDLNRCGTPLLEVVSEPDMNSYQEARAYLDRLKQTAQYLEISDCDMEKGNLRVDLNISIRKEGVEKLGTRREVKNLNSFKMVEQAIRHEVEMQADTLENGGEIEQCTMLWDEGSNSTTVIRTKEDAPDYRYFPDPDLPPMKISNDLIQEIRNSLPELPGKREKRFQDDYGLSSVDAKILSRNRPLADYFEDTIKEGATPSRAANWIMVQVLRYLDVSGGDIQKFPIQPLRLAELINAMNEKLISNPSAKSLFKMMLRDQRPTIEIIKTEGLKLEDDAETLSELIKSVIKEHTAEFERLKGGEEKLMGFFIGQVMRGAGGKADPGQISKILAELRNKKTN